MLILALSCLRAGSNGRWLVDAMLSGNAHDARSVACRLLTSEERSSDKADQAALGQIVARSLLLAGREQEAEEIYQRQHKCYETLERPMLRWMPALDRGAMALALNRAGRACEHFNLVADDADAPVPLRVEGMAGLAAALQALGESRRAERTLQYALQLARLELPAAVPLLEACLLEVTALQHLRSFDEGGSAPGPQTDAHSLAKHLGETAQRLAEVPIASRRMAFLAAAMSPSIASVEEAGRVNDALRWLREHHLLAVEETARVEAALAFTKHNSPGRVEELLGRIASDQRQLSQHRRSLDLRFCLSRVHVLRGRAETALQLYREHSAQLTAQLRTELPRIPYSRFLEKQAMRDNVDALGMQLPLRYRRAYQFIVEHLEDSELSIRHVAAHIDVSDRALQLAFKAHLGMTPAQLIRTRRMECIRAELRSAATQDTVLKVASRWGVNSRSTFAHNFRVQFGETPTALLRQSGEGPDEHAPSPACPQSPSGRRISWRVS